MTRKNGSVKAGPSRAYLRLLEGKISSRQYSEKVKKSVGKSLTTPHRIEGADKAPS